MKTLALLLFITSSYSQADTENRFEVTIIQEYPFGWGCVEPAHPEDAKAALQEKADNDCGYQRPDHALPVSDIIFVDLGSSLGSPYTGCTLTLRRQFRQRFSCGW